MIGDLSQTSPEYRELSKDLIKLSKQSSLSISPQSLKLADRKLSEVKAKLSNREFTELQLLFHNVLKIKWKESLTETDLQRHYHSLEQTSSVNEDFPVEKERFLQTLNSKTLGHLLGDSFLAGMKTESGTKLEGNSQLGSMEFLVSSLEYLLKTKFSHFSLEDRDKVQRIIDKFKTAIKFAKNNPFGEITVETAASLIRTLTEEVKNQIMALKENDTLLIPWGWNNKDIPGHAMMMEYCPSTGILKVFNTGGGVEFHEQDNRFSKAYVNTVKIYKIPCERFLERLPVLMEPRILSSVTNLMEWNTPFSAQDLYAKLVEYEISSRNVEDVWQKAQMSGSCSLRCCMAYLSSKVGTETYKSFKHSLEKEVISAVLEEPSRFQLTPEMSKIFSAAIPNLFGHLQKTGKREDLKELERLKALYESVQGEKQMVLQGPPATTDNVKLYAFSLDLSQEKEQAAKSDNTVRIISSSIPAQELTECSNITELLENLKRRTEYFHETGTSENRPYIQESLCQIGRLLTNPVYSAQKEKLLNELKGDASLIIQTRNLVVSLVNSLYESKQKNRNDLKQLMAYQSAYLFIYELAKLSGQQEGREGLETMDSYGLNSSVLLELPNAMAGVPSLLNRELEEDYQHLLTASNTLHQKPHRFNDYERNKHVFYGSSFYIPKESGDYLIAEALAKKKKPEDWTAADNEYADLKLRKQVENVSLSEFRIGWCYLNLLPIELQELRKLSFMMKTDSAFCEVSRGEPRLNDLKFFTLHTDSDTVNFQYLSDPTPLKSLRSPDPDLFAPKVYDMTVFLVPRDQNEALIETKGLFYGNHSLHPIHFSEMIDRLRPSLEDLRKQQTQFYFRATLFHPFKLYEALKDNPALASDLLHFFEDALNYYRFKAVVAMNKTERTQTLAFLMEQKARALAWMQKLKSTEPLAEKQLSQLRTQLKELLSHPDFQEKEIQQHLGIALIESYGSQEKLSPTEINQLLTARSIVAKYPKSERLSKELFDSLSHIMVKHSKSIQLLDDQQWNELLLLIGKHYQTDFPQNLKIEKRFPLIFATFPGGTISFDCESGTIKLNGDFLLFSEESFYDSKQYGMVFQGDRFPLRKVLSGFNIEVPNASIKYVQDKDQYIREFEGRQYIFYMQPTSSPRIPHGTRNQLWISPDKTTNPQALVVNPRTREIIYTNYNQDEFTFGTKGPRYKLTTIKEDPNWISITSFDSGALLWQPVDSAKNPLLQLPNTLDDSGSPLEFELINKNEWRWSKHPQYHLSNQFSIANLNLKGPFLTLEKTNGEKELIISDPITSKITRLTLKNSLLAPQNSAYKNLVCAYLTLLSAANVQDYEKVVAFLQRSREYRRYNDEELKLLGWIVKSMEENQDHFPDAFGCRLFAVTLVYENFERYPDLTNRKVTPSEAKEILEINKEWSKEKWVLFWKETVSRKAIASESIKLILKGYFERENNVSKKTKLSLLVNEYKLKKWGLEKESGLTQAGLEQLPAVQGWYSIMKIAAAMIETQNLKEGYPPSSTRLAPGSLPQHLPYLLKIAFGADKQARAKLKDFLFDTRFEKESLNRQSLVVLWAAFASKEPISNDNTEWQKLINTIRMSAGTIFDKNQLRLGQFHKSSTITALSDIAKHVQDFLNKEVPPIRSGKHPRKTPEMFNEPLPVTIPDKPPHFDLSYPPASDLFAHLNQTFDKYFMWPKDAESVLPPRLFDGADKTRIKALNEEYIKGYRKNYKDTHIELKGSAEETHRQLVKSLLPDLMRIEESETAKRELLEQLILEKGNYALLNDPKLRQEIGRNLRSYLTIDDLINLYLQKSIESFKKLTGLTTADQINTLFQLIGNFLEISGKSMVQKEIISKLQQLEKEKHPSAQAFQEIGKALATIHPLETSRNPEAVLVFEHKLNLLLRDHQIQGLNDLSEPQSRFLQRIQAGGKTLIWGHLLALMKADGYHLSLHVSPSHQYASNLYDMGDRSRYAFEQNQKTLIFDDHPNYFTLDHLFQMKKILEEAIINREYLHTTNDTLRALRCKYIKTALQIHLHPKMAESDLAELRQKNEVLRFILTLLRARGVFTFDEVHQAMDAQKELNMPYGAVTHPDLKQTKLIHSIINFAAGAKDENGRSLSQIAENRSATLNSQQKIELKKKVVERLLADPQWRETFGVTSPEKEAIVKSYLLTSNADFPPSLETKDKERNTLLILAHQMIGGGWLEDALAKSVQEHYGVVQAPGLVPIAIPFLANMTPAIGSEFSDVYVMMANTFISYLVQGISPVQAKEFIDFVQSHIIEEYDALKVKNPDATLQDTTLYKNFNELSQACGFSLNLTTLDREDFAQLNMIQKMLSQDSEISHSLLFDFITSKVISHVELHENQVTTNGRATATLAKITNGYSASLDNPHIAPIMDAKGNRVAVTQDPGTNGQTIDLLIRKFPDVWVIRPQPESLFSDLIDKLPDHRKKRVKAIIDGESHFRGVPNDIVARMICDKIDNPQIKGVLFFNNSTGKLCFMTKSDPANVKELKGTTPQVIAEETDCDPEELFVYFDQDHGTGTNLTLGGESIAVSTIGAENQLHDKLQCDRRMRQLDQYQEIITAVGSDSLEKVSALLQKPEISEFSAGEVVRDKSFIQDILLYLYLKESNHEQKLNLQYCLQDMENAVQQFLLDQVFSGNLEESRVFGILGDLYIKNVFVDLYQEYAKKKVGIPIQKYLQTVSEFYLSRLKVLKLPSEDMKQVADTLKAIINATVKDMQQTIDVSPDYGRKEKPLSADRETTNIHMQQKKQVNEQEEERESQRQNVAKGLTETKNPLLEKPFDSSLLLSATITGFLPSDIPKLSYDKKTLYENLKRIVDSRDYADKKTLLYLLKNYKEDSFDVDILFNAVTQLSSTVDYSKQVSENLTKNRIARAISYLKFVGEEAEKLSYFYLSMKSDPRLSNLSDFNESLYEIDRLMVLQNGVVLKDLDKYYQELLSIARKHIPDYKPPYQPPIPNVFFSLSHLIADQRKVYKGIFDSKLLATANFIRTTSNDFVNVLDHFRKPVQQMVLICDTNPATKVQQWSSIMVTHNEAKFLAEQMKEMKFPPNRRLWLVRPQGELVWPGPFPYDSKEIRSNPQAMRQFVQALFYSGNLYYLSKPPWIETFKEWIASLGVNERKSAKDFFEKEVLRGPMLEKYLASGLPKLWDTRQEKPEETEGLISGFLRFFK